MRDLLKALVPYVVILAVNMLFWVIGIYGLFAIYSVLRS